MAKHPKENGKQKNNLVLKCESKKHGGNFFAKWNFTEVGDHVALFIFLERMLRNS